MVTMAIFSLTAISSRQPLDAWNNACLYSKAPRFREKIALTRFLGSSYLIENVRKESYRGPGTQRVTERTMLLMRRKYWSYRKPLSYSWAKTDRDITRRMNMFKSYLDSLPKNRLDYVTDLDIPDITLSPYEWTDLDDYCYTLRRDGYLSDSWRDYYLKSSLSTDSSIPLSRALTDSDIDYEFYKRYKSCKYGDTWGYLRDAVHRFPSDYLASLNRYIPLDTEVDAELLNSEVRYAAELAANRRRYNEERRRRLQRRFEEECSVYPPGDSSLLELQDAIRKLDMKALEADLASIKPSP